MSGDVIEEMLTQQLVGPLRRLQSSFPRGELPALGVRRRRRWLPPHQTPAEKRLVPGSRGHFALLGLVRESLARLHSVLVVAEVQPGR